MRIISPVVEMADIGEEELLNAMVANFHSALDVKYALSDEIIWSVFIHPLRELSEYQVRDAIESGTLLTTPLKKASHNLKSTPLSSVGKLG